MQNILDQRKLTRDVQTEGQTNEQTDRDRQTGQKRNIGYKNQLVTTISLR